MGRWIFAGLVILAVTVGVVAYVDQDGWGPNDGWRERDAQVVTTQDGDTIVVERDHRVFPFFVFFPVLILGLIFLLGPWRHRNDRWHGPGPGSDWLNEWHRRQHEQPGSNP